MIPVKDQNSNVHCQANELYSKIEGNFILDSLIVVNPEEDRGLYRFSRQHPHHKYQDYIVFKIDMSNLKNHWNDASPCPVVNDKFSALTFKHLKIPKGMFEVWWTERNLPNRAMVWVDDELVADGWYVNDPLENIDLNHIRSVREPRPIFIQKGLKAPQAKMISCFYSNEVIQVITCVNTNCRLHCLFIILGILGFLSKSSSSEGIKIASTTCTR